MRQRGERELQNEKKKKSAHFVSKNDIPRVVCPHTTRIIQIYIVYRRRIVAYNTQITLSRTIIKRG